MPRASLGACCNVEGGQSRLFADANELKAAVVACEPRAFVSEHLLEITPHAFAGDGSAWSKYRLSLADKLDVDPQEIVLMGSAGLGFSLNPRKGFSAFHAGSDFDFGVVSSYHFDLAWRYLRQSQVRWLSLPAEVKRAIRQHRQNYVFTGTIAANWFLTILPFGKTWQAALDDMGELAPSVGRTVSLRIYKDFDSLRFYQANNIRKLRDKLITPDDDTSVEITSSDIDEEVV